ncbi:hypothetical protein EV359DRAFT_68458 [Lentinula novae-zelandiae]|nr:hypothetical protein EV359DRAFT_68458 [Lentinula novae-zelandiae]
MHLLCSVFSSHQLGLFLWLLKVNGVEDATSVKSMKALDSKLQKLYGIQTIKYKGAMGHTYYVNSLADIIAQKMANPQVRPHLSFYPEEKSNNLSEAWQFSQWFYEVPDEQVGPMLCIGMIDYYTFEPVMLTTGNICMPHRWYMHGGRYYAHCWKMVIICSGGQRFWRVVMGHGGFTVEQNQFLKNFPQLIEDAALYPNLVDVRKIRDPTVTEWKLTDSSVGNPWRQHAAGAECLSFPIWLYCDDTSGNVSKRWNKHNSFLFTTAGLPRSESSKEYNVHFLATSNSAPPLEMLDGITDQISDAQEHGIWAWDCATESKVLVIPFVLAMLGDNPMQNSDAASVGSAHSANHRKKSKCRKFKERLGAMVQRVKDFVKPSKPGALQNKHETIESLKSQFIAAQTPGSATRIKAMRTESGVKDTYQAFFIDRLLKSHKRHRGVSTSTLNETVSVTDLPSETKSPIWRIQGLDPHLDTPVEILHVILLGFVKYLWRDVIQNQVKKNKVLQERLIALLCSLNVDGLGLDSNLNGHTLVKHYGSLTGSDFRKICELAPFVLKDMPEIKDLSAYLDTLKAEIDHFLACVGHWTVRWFNKPKFHILVHLPEHIRCFGPAMLFAMEGFESFNAVIRSKSVHSNRQAPSLDIAAAFAKQNHVRHMLSGALFLDQSKVSFDDTEDKNFENTSLPQQQRITRVQYYFCQGLFSKNHWVKAGRSPIEVIAYSSNTVGQYLGLSASKKSPAPGTITLDSTITAQCWFNTQSGHSLPSSDMYTSAQRLTANFHQAKALWLTNGDKCIPGSYVACKGLETGHNVDGIAIAENTADSVLLEVCRTGPEVSVHGMPRLIPSEEIFIVQPNSMYNMIAVGTDVFLKK